MNTRPALLRSIPFWVLVVASVVSIAVGGWLFNTKIGQMATAITQGSQTAAVDVYVGQSVAVLAAALVGAGAVGILLAFAVATLATLRPKAPVEVVEPADWTEEQTIEAFAPQEVPAAPVEVPAAPAAAAPAAGAEAPAAPAANDTEADAVR